MAAKDGTIRSGWHEAWGLLLFAFCILLLLSLVSYESGDVSVIQNPPNDPARNFIGPAGAWVAFIAFMLLGVAAYLLPVAVGIQGLFLILRREQVVWPKAVWLTIMLAAFVCLAELQTDLWRPLVERLNISGAGGVLGYLLGQAFLIRYLGTGGTAILTIAVLVVGLVVLFRVQPITMFRQVGALFALVSGRLRARWLLHLDRRAQMEQEQQEIQKQRKRLERVVGQQQAEAGVPPRPRISRTVTADDVRKEQKPAPAPVVPPEPAPEKKPLMARPKPEPPRKPEPPPAPVPPRPAPEISGPWKLPSIALLDQPPPPDQREIKEDFQASAMILKETLAEFGIEADVTNVARGPVVTRYELLPAAGVRVEKITALGNNIALAMKAESVRIQAPIPGKGVVGIEVPNSKTTTVFLREILESQRWQSSSAALPLAVGKDVSGKEIVADLGGMPHLLIAGATGSGKTVCMNSVLAGLLMSRTPDQLRLMLIDPKIVEFSQYNSLPHLVVPVISNPKKVNLGLRWAITEMENRYKLFAKVGVRNIEAYNSRPIAKQAELFQDAPPPEEESRQPPDRLPYVVIVVDELADLMMVAQADIENSIARLAQLSRAVGIHMILATQRPSVNVITGTIKANFPARLAFQVAQKTDSRTILDANGADKLLGKGDMLFLPPGSSKLLRAQGTLTTDQEISRIVEFWKQQGTPQYEVAVAERIESKSADLPEQEEDDDLMEAAVEVIRQTRRASTSSLQRRLRIGYTRAARLMDILEERGIIGPPCGSDPREILIDLDGEIPQNEEQVVE